MQETESTNCQSSIWFKDYVDYMCSLSYRVEMCSQLCLRGEFAFAVGMVEGFGLETREK